MFFSSLWALAALPSVLALPGLSQSEPRALSKRCVNSASDRSCWGDYDISTDYYDTVPDTGVTREYWFNVENTYVRPPLGTAADRHLIVRA